MRGEFETVGQLVGNESIGRSIWPKAIWPKAIWPKAIEDNRSTLLGKRFGPFGFLFAEWRTHGPSVVDCIIPTIPVTSINDGLKL